MYVLQKYYRKTEHKPDISYSRSSKGRPVDLFFSQILISREPGIFLDHTSYLEG